MINEKNAKKHWKNFCPSRVKACWDDRFLCVFGACALITLLFKLSKSLTSGSLFFSTYLPSFRFSPSPSSAISKTPSSWTPLVTPLTKPPLGTQKWLRLLMLIRCWISWLGLSFALPVGNGWLIKIFQFPFHQLLILSSPACCFASFLSLRNWQKCISFSGFHLANVLLPSRSNKYISCYLFINMDGVFRQTNSWYVVLYLVLSAFVTSFSWLFFSCCCRWGNHFWTFICIKSRQAAERCIRWNISQQIKSIFAFFSC